MRVTSPAPGWNELAEGLFCKRYDPIDVTITAVLGAEGILLVDTRCSPAEGREIKEELARITRLPVRWVVNTHAHYDHILGNAEFDAPRLVPPAEFRAHENVRSEFDAQGVRIPDRLVGEYEPVDIGGRNVELHWLGRGHTDADLVLWLPRDGVLIAGDVIEESGPPAYGSDSFPLDWAGTLAELMLMTEGDAVYVPGHGNPVDHEFVLTQHSYIVEVGAQIEALYRSGIPVTAALASGSWPERDAESFRGAVARGYAQLSGEIS